ncbi:tetratricopeptide repeat protein [Pseudoalteromonas sp. A757]|uniref:tetratricopeptide repeat protein n=1 Tax=Pseudoalteromonas sp. A757 TaxID=2250709 RepID=UPI001875139B|nr:tetratricopeptide repeat protein [Pseudoalteromonas sp. A757]
MLPVLIVVSSLTVLAPDELFKTLRVIQDLNISNPAQATRAYEAVLPKLPVQPSKGLYELHRAGLEASIKSNNVRRITEIVELFSESADWLTYLQSEKGLIANNLAIYYRRINQPALAQINYECALRYSTHDQRPRIVNNLAVLYRTMGQLKEAINILTPTLSDVKDEQLEAALNNNLANVYFDMSKYQHAARLYRQAFLYHQKSGQAYEASYTGLNLLNVYLLANQWKNYRRYRNTVKAQLSAAEDRELSIVFMWQELIFQKSRNGLNPKAEQVEFLMSTLPKLIQSDYGSNMEKYVYTLQLPELIASYNTLLSEQQKTSPNVSTEAQLLGVALSWCESNNS